MKGHAATRHFEQGSCGMEYRGFEYVVVQSIFPDRWRWSVTRDHIEKAGTSDTREAAIFRAKRIINKLTEARLKPSRRRSNPGRVHIAVF
jgi:hypothetical protein